MKKLFSSLLVLFAAVSLYAADLNIYASGLKASQVDNMCNVEYILNAPATTLELMLYTDDITSAMSMAVTDPEALTKGAHTLQVTLPQDVPAGVYHWAMKVTGGETQFADVLNGDGMYNYYLPQDVAVDNNFNSPFFGRVYVSESYDGASDGMSDATKLQTRGIYMYNADMTFVNGDSMALTGYDGGMGGNRSARNAVKRIAIDNGYVYIASRDEETKGIWRMDPANPTDPFVQVLSVAESVDAIAIADNSVYTLEGIGVGMGTMNKYALSEAMGNPVVFGQDTIIHFASYDCDAAPDGRGGFWMAQNRWNKDTYPCLVHVNSLCVRDYLIDKDNNGDLLTQGHNASYRGVVAVSHDGSMVAMGSDKSAVVFSVVYDESTGVPTLTRIMATPQFGSNIDGLAFDVANNLYVASASTERLYAFPIPKVANEFITPAPERSKVYIGVPAPVQHLYLIGDNTGWDPTSAPEMANVDDNIFEGVFTFTNDTNHFAFLDALAEVNDGAGWDYVNAHRYAGNGDAVLLSTVVAKDTLVKVNNTFRIPQGVYRLRVDFNTNMISVFRQGAVVPEGALYIAFKDIIGLEGSDDGDAKTALNDIVKTGADLVSEVTASKVYMAREGCGVKLGSSKAAGSLTLTLVNSVTPAKIIVNAVSYGATEGTAILLGDTVDLTQYGNKVLVPYVKEYDGLTAVSELTFATTTKRMYLLDVIIIPAENVEPFAYKIKHPWDTENLDPWIWKACEEQEDGTWALTDVYMGGGCNIDPKVLEQDWIDAPTLVGNPYAGDSCVFVINPNATEVADILTITKLGEPNVDVTVYEHLYEIGDNQGWHPAQAIEMTNKSENVFEGTFEFTGETSYFAFITVKPETDDWTVTNANRFGGATNNELIADGGTYNLALGELCLTAAQGKYTITVDMTAKTASVVKETEDGLENINGENNVQKVIENGHVYIIRDGVRYTATGARVE